MPAEGYGPEVIRDFIVRFGSIENAEKAAKASPGFGDEIREVESRLGGGLIPSADPHAAALLGAELRALRRELIVAALEEDEPARTDDLPERVLAFLAREQPPPKLKPGPKPTDVPAKTKKRIAELRIANEGIAEIRRDTGLSKTIATRLVRDVDDALGEIRAGRY